MIIYTEEELRRYVGLNDQAIEVVEAGFTKLEKGDVTMPPIMRIDVHDQHGEVDVKTAYVKGRDMFAIKVSSGFFHNYKHGLPSGSGLMMLISTETGVPKALLLDNGYLTDVRTAAAGAIAAKYLSRENIDTVGVIGAGNQAKFQVRAINLVRNFNRVMVYARSQDRAQKYAEEMEKELGIPVEVSGTAERVVRMSDTVITTTPATEPVIKAAWIHPGLHITAMGSDAEHKQELEGQVLARADKLVCDTKAQCKRLGELHHALKDGALIRDSSVIELGKLTSKQVKGRENEEEITVCDLTGTGVQDTVIALYAYQHLGRRGVGAEI